MSSPASIRANLIDELSGPSSPDEMPAHHGVSGSASITTFPGSPNEITALAAVTGVVDEVSDEL